MINLERLLCAYLRDANGEWTATNRVTRFECPQTVEGTTYAALSCLLAGEEIVGDLEAAADHEITKERDPEFDTGTNFAAVVQDISLAHGWMVQAVEALQRNLSDQELLASFRGANPYPSTWSGRCAESYVELSLSVADGFLAVLDEYGDEGVARRRFHARIFGASNNDDEEALPPRERLGEDRIAQAVRELAVKVPPLRSSHHLEIHLTKELQRVTGEVRSQHESRALTDAESLVLRAIDELHQDGVEWPTNKQIAARVPFETDTVRKVTGQMKKTGPLQPKPNGNGCRLSRPRQC